MSREPKSAPSRGSLLGPLAEIARAVLERRVSAPSGFDLPGVVALLLFCVLVVTGLLLMVYYRPSATAAHFSIGVIQDEVRLGWLVRGLHYWSTHLLIAVSLVHLGRVYFARAYVPPRHLAWASGVVLLVLVFAFGFTGTLLPWDQYAYWATDAARQTISGVPFVGSMLLGLFWGGWEIGEEVLLRFYALHVGALPLVTVLVLSVHVLLVARRRLDARDDSSGTDATRIAELLPGLLTATLLACGVLVTLAVVFPPALGEPADPLAQSAPTVPRWYLTAAHALLRRFSGGGATILVTVLFVVALAVPILDRREPEPRWRRVVRWGIGLGVLACWAWLSARRSLA